jgi:hypothetical protein
MENSDAEQATPSESEEKTSEQTETTETTPSPLEEARALQESNKALVTQITEERKKLEKIQADLMISGRSQINNKPKPVEETAKEYAEKVLSGKIKPI